MKIRVTDGYQVKHAGKMYRGGDTFDASEAEAKGWIDAGLAKAVGGSANKAITSAETPNKGGGVKVNRSTTRKTTRKVVGKKT
jgi:hypothetical protein